MFQPANKSRLGRLLLVAFVCGSALSFSGCGEKKEEPQARPMPPPQARDTRVDDPYLDDYDNDYDDTAPRGRVGAVPAGMTLDDLRFELGIDRRVAVNPTQAVSDRTAAESALRFCEALLRGDAQAFSRMLAPEDRKTMERLVADGLWQAETGAIREVAILRLSPLGRGFQLTIGMDGSAVIRQEWIAQPNGEGYRFAALTGYANYGSSRSLAQLKSEYFSGIAGDPIAAADIDEFDFEAALQQAMERAESGAATADEEEAEPYESPSMNPRDHIRRRFYPGG